jgi:hypothetical protein
MKLKVGQYVRHDRYGWGTILECARHHTTVYFCSVGVRKLTVSEAVFQVVEDPVALKRRGGQSARAGFPLMSILPSGSAD